MIKRALIWPPHYTITKKQRARHVTIKITLKKGLEFVVPIRFNKIGIPKLLITNRSWIQKQLRLIYQEFKEIQAAPLPSKIDLLAIRQSWKVKYRVGLSDMHITANQKQKILTVIGNIKDKPECRKHLNKLLIPKLNRVSNQIGLKFKDAVIRNQSSRLASCSTRKRISLNYKLIFLSETLCKHIFIHELCHTVHLDHSKRFWQLVAKYDTHWERNYEAMQLSEKRIPVWSREWGSSFDK